MMNEFRPARFQVLPNIVKNVIMINVIMVVLQLILARTFHINLQDYLALHYWRSPLFRPWQLLTHIFMHGSPYDLQATALHLFSNMFALWIFGNVLEHRWGPQRFLIFYLLCGIGASLCFMAVQAIDLEPLYKSYRIFVENPTLDYYQKFLFQNEISDPATVARWSMDPGNLSYSNGAVKDVSAFVAQKLNGPMVGASGAVYGILFAFGYLFPNTELILLFPPIPVKAKYLVGFYALFELYTAFQNDPNDNVAHVAHLGGMLVAFILLKFWFQRQRQRFY
jgi:membrane associated rhomboid family serine protease